VLGRCRQVKLVVAKCWDASPHGYFLPPRGDEPVRPIDPSAWVAHTEAVRQEGGFTGPTPGLVPPSFGLMPSFGPSSSVDSSPVSSMVAVGHSTCKQHIQLCFLLSCLQSAGLTFSKVLRKILGRFIILGKL